MFGSPRAAHALMAHDLVDGHWLFVMLGQGIPLFQDVRGTQQLHLLDSTRFDSGVVSLHYERRD